jgi:hypothetical protein
MSLSLNQPIRASDIMEARELKDGKVFLLKGKDGSSIVIKAEDHVSGAQIKAAAPVVKAIDAAVKMKPLQQAEALELQQFMRTWSMYAAFIDKLAGEGNSPIDNAEKQCMKELKTCLDKYGLAGPGGRTNIAKMTCMNMSTLGIVLEVEGKPLTDASWTEARETFGKFIKALNKSGGLEKLGQIMAGDFFISNGDRFSSDGSGMGIKLHTTKFHRLKVIVNLGNIILVKEGKGAKTRPSMLDYMDPNRRQFADDNKAITAMETDDKKWSFRVLLDKTSRKKIASDLADDLNHILQPEKSLFGKSRVGGSGAASRIDKGIVIGIKAITKSLGAKQGRLTPRIQSAYDEMRKV